VKIRASADFFLSLLLIFLSNSLPYALLFLSAAAVHEAGHITFLKVYKIKKPVLSLGLLGGCITADMTRLSYRQEASVYLGGAVFNILACIVSLGVMRRVSGELLIFFFFASLFYAALNLLPISTLDGGRALECVLLSLSDNPFCVLRVCRYVSLVFSSVTVGLSAALLFCFKGNLTLVLLLAWIVFTAYFQSPPDAAPRTPQLRRHSTG